MVGIRFPFFEKSRDRRWLAVASPALKWQNSSELERFVHE